MKKILYILAALLTMSIAANAQILEKTFEEGNKLYTEGNYKAASVSYQKVIDAGYSSTNLYYNLGNAYYKQKLYGKAILNYERALRLSPTSHQIKENLELAKTKTKDRIDAIPSFFLSEWLKGIQAIFSANGWATMSLLFLLAFGVLFLCYRFLDSILVKKITFYGSFLFLFLAIVAIWNANIKTKMLKHPNAAIVLAPSTVVKSSPDESGKDRFVLHEGAKITFTESLPVSGWREIRIADGNVGWIESSTFEVI